jgi:tetratricopeptide (TPR) repeat protein
MNDDEIKGPNTDSEDDNGTNTNLSGNFEGPVALNGEAVDLRYSVGAVYKPNIFVGDYVSLEDAYINPTQVFNRVNPEEFVGRAWLTAELDYFFTKYDRGVFLIEGEAGVGKTSYLAHLVHQHDYIHLFAELAPGQAGLRDLQCSLLAQLIARYDINLFSEKRFLPAAAVRNDTISDAFELAAESANPSRVVVLIDALDEAGTFPNQNVLGLPRTLPKGVYLVVSQRPVEVPMYFDDVPRYRFELNAEDENNFIDMQRYLNDVAEQSWLKPILVEQGTSVEDFVTKLVTASQGLWIYLHFVLGRARQTQRINLETLPMGIVDYYLRYWSSWRKDARWDDLWAPLLTALAVAQEPVTIDQLLGWTRLQVNPYQIQRILKEDWRPFLITFEQAETFRFYHKSLTDFVTGEISNEVWQTLTSQQKALIEELRARTFEAHQWIFDYYQLQTGGQWRKLREIGDDYPFRHLTSHIASTGSTENLIELIENQEWLVGHQFYDLSLNSLSLDIQRTISAMEKSGQEAKFLSCVMAYRLYLTAIHNRAQGIPPGTLSVLIQLGFVERALNFSELLQENERFDAFLGIADQLLLLNQNPEDAIMRARLSTQQILERDERHKAIGRLARTIAKTGDVKRALDLLDDIGDFDFLVYCPALGEVTEVCVDLGDKEGLLLIKDKIEKHRGKGLPGLTRVVAPLSRGMFVLGDHDEAMSLLKWAEEEARTLDINSPVWELDSVRPLALTYACFGQYEQALQIADRYENYYPDDLLAAIAAEVVKRGEYEVAEPLLSHRKDTYDDSRPIFYSAISQAALQVGQVDLARKYFHSAVQIRRPRRSEISSLIAYLNDVLFNLGVYVGQVGNRDELALLGQAFDDWTEPIEYRINERLCLTIEAIAKSAASAKNVNMLNSLIVFTKRFTEKKYRIEAKTHLALGFTQVGRQADAWTQLEDILYDASTLSLSQSWENQIALATLANEAAGNGNPDLSLEIANKCSLPTARIEALIEWLKIQEYQLETVDEIALQLRQVMIQEPVNSPYFDRAAILHVATELARSRCLKATRAVLEVLWGESDPIKFETNRSIPGGIEYGLLENFINTLIENNGLEFASQIFPAITDPKKYSKALINLASMQADNEEIQKALATAEKIREAKGMSDFYSAITQITQRVGGHSHAKHLIETIMTKENEPSSWDASYLLALTALGWEDDAARYVDTVVKQCLAGESTERFDNWYSRSSFLADIANTLKKGGMDDKANKTFDQALEIWDQWHDVYFLTHDTCRITRTAENLGRNADARELLHLAQLSVDKVKLVHSGVDELFFRVIKDFCRSMGSVAGWEDAVWVANHLGADVKTSRQWWERWQTYQMCRDTANLLRTTVPDSNFGSYQIQTMFAPDLTITVDEIWRRIQLFSPLAVELGGDAFVDELWQRLLGVKNLFEHDQAAIENAEGNRIVIVEDEVFVVPKKAKVSLWHRLKRAVLRVLNQKL